MKYILGGIEAVCVFLGAGCISPSATQVSEFEPPTGTAENPAPQSAGERRLLIATSTDGKTFTPTGEVFTEQGNVPDAVVTEDGTIFMYYIGQGIEEGKETTAVAISTDNGDSWTFRFLEFNNWPSPRPPSDPDVVLLEDGTFRMFYTDNIDKNRLGIAYGESEDGISFTYQGAAFDAGFNVIDSSTFYADDRWHMLVLDEKEPVQYHATSSDGETFELISEEPITLPENYIISNPIIENDVVRMFGFGDKNADMKWFTSSDVVTWKLGGTAMKHNESSTLGGDYLQDMTIAPLSDGTYLMVYVTNYGE